MGASTSGAGTRRIDKLGVAFAALLVIAACGAAYAALKLHWFASVWEMAGWLLAAIAFVGVGLGVHTYRPPRGGEVYGKARAASEGEAQQAARGDTKVFSLHDEVFPN